MKMIFIIKQAKPKPRETFFSSAHFYLQLFNAKIGDDFLIMYKSHGRDM